MSVEISLGAVDRAAKVLSALPARLMDAREATALAAGMFAWRRLPTPPLPVPVLDGKKPGPGPVSFGQLRAMIDQQLGDIGRLRANIARSLPILDALPKPLEDERGQLWRHDFSDMDGVQLVLALDRYREFLMAVLPLLPGRAGGRLTPGSVYGNPKKHLADECYKLMCEYGGFDNSPPARKRYREFTGLVFEAATGAPPQDSDDLSSYMKRALPPKSATICPKRNS